MVFYLKWVRFCWIWIILTDFRLFLWNPRHTMPHLNYFTHFWIISHDLTSFRIIFVSFTSFLWYIIIFTCFCGNFEKFPSFLLKQRNFLFIYITFSLKLVIFLLNLNSFNRLFIILLKPSTCFAIFKLFSWFLQIFELFYSASLIYVENVYFSTNFSQHCTRFHF